MEVISIWIQASRPKTLVASLVPIYVALQLFLQEGSLDQKTCIITFTCLVFVKILTDLLPYDTPIIYLLFCCLRRMEHTFCPVP